MRFPTQSLNLKQSLFYKYSRFYECKKSRRVSYLHIVFEALKATFCSKVGKTDDLCQGLKAHEISSPKKL